MQIIILSGLSGAGKSVALHMLEDLGYYCIDNIPAALLKPFISYTVRSNEKLYARTAVGLDARNSDADFSLVPTLIDELKRSAIDCEVLFLVADDQELLRRFAETRRAHPLGRQGETLREAIASERRLLEPIADIADQVIDTTRMGVHQLRDLINRRVDPRSPDRLSIQFESDVGGHPRCGVRRHAEPERRPKTQYDDERIGHGPVRCALAPQSLLGKRAAAPDWA